MCVNVLENWVSLRWTLYDDTIYKKFQRNEKQ